MEKIKDVISITNYAYQILNMKNFANIHKKIKLAALMMAKKYPFALIKIHIMINAFINILFMIADMLKIKITVYLKQMKHLWNFLLIQDALIPFCV